MDPYSRWTIILSRGMKRKLLPLDIEHCSPIALRSIVLDVRTQADVLDKIAQAYSDDEYILRDLVRCPNLSETTLAFIALTASDEIKTFISGTRAVDVVHDEKDDKTAASGVKKKLNVTQMINRMTTPQKIKLALSGGKEARGMLIRESNKQISQAVLANPQIKESEVEFFAKSTNLSEDVLRKIGMNSDWTKKFSIVHALVHNARCPVGIAVSFVPRMSDKDLAMLEKSKSVSNAVRTAARALIARKKSSKKQE